MHDTIDEGTWVAVGFLRAARLPGSIIPAVVIGVPRGVVLRPGGSAPPSIRSARHVRLADNDEDSADEPCTPAEYRCRIGTPQARYRPHAVQVPVAPSRLTAAQHTQKEMRLCT